MIDLPGPSPAMAVAQVLDCTIQPHRNVYVARLRFTCISDDDAGRIIALLDRRSESRDPDSVEGEQEPYHSSYSRPRPAPAS